MRVSRCADGLLLLVRLPDGPVSIPIRACSRCVRWLRIMFILDRRRRRPGGADRAWLSPRHARAESIRTRPAGKNLIARRRPRWQMKRMTLKSDDRRSRRHCPRSHPLPVGDAGRGRGARLFAADTRASGIYRASRHLRRARHRADRQPLCPHRRRKAEFGVRRPHRRGAAGRRGGMAASAVRRRHRGRQALWARRGRHEGRHRLLRRRRARSSCRQRRQAEERLALAADHRRRGERRGQRHGQAVEMGGRARRDFRSLHPRRAEQCRGARRHHQGRPPRLAQRHADRHRPPGPCRLSGPRRQSDPRARDA